jgi:sialic acid synthase SpsE
MNAALGTKLPLIVSTGAANEYEIRQAVSRIAARGARDRLILLHCISCYPTPVQHANLRAIARMAEVFGVPVGFSDHTTSEDAGAYAVAAGACVLEKHFTLDRSASGPDHALSLEPSQLRAYVAHVREAESALGCGTLGMSEIEKPVRDVARRSVVSAVAIPAGAVLTDSMLTLKRPGTGISPDCMAGLVGRRTRQTIPADTPLEWGMLA